jgi:Ca-activated chloride channel family protein
MSDSERCQSSERIKLLERELIDTFSEPRRLFGSFENEKRESGRPALPLASVDISANVVDRIASVTVVQKFVNQLKEPIEAVYIFPLAGSSSVSRFQMQVGERVIEGLIKERAVARQEYQAAVDEGKRAAILEQERDDVFTAQVGNIMPGEEITVTIVYSERLAYFASGHTEIRLPLVVAPRYVAGVPLDRDSVGDGVEPDTDKVSDASRITPPRLAPGFDPKVSLSLSVNIELADDDQVADLVCSQHATKSGFGKNGIKVGLAKDDEPLDRDFVLSWKLAAADLKSIGLVTEKAVPIKEVDFQYGMVSINPPALEQASSKVVARDVVFLLDRSGSMNGLKMTSAARALIILLNTLRPDDRFAICAFDTTFEWLEDSGRQHKFFPASLKAIERGVTYLRSIDARGGTEMQGALEDCFDLIEQAAAAEKSTSKNKAKRQAIVVLITDGEVADESHILRTIQGRVNATRVFTVGVDTAVNDGFLKRLASLGGGTSTFVPPGDALENALISVAREIGVPLVTDLHIVDNKQLTCAPRKTIDLFEGRPVSIYFQCTSDKLPQTIEVVGRLANGGKYKEKISLRPTANAALPQLYAKARISELEDLMRDSIANEGQIYEREIVELSVAHSLLTRFTAFLAVDHSEIANPSGDLRKLVQPVETPAQWKELPPSAGAWGAAPSGASIRMRQAAQPASPSQISGSTGMWGGGGGWGAPSAGSIDGSASSGAWGAAGPMPAYPAPENSLSAVFGRAANSLGGRAPESEESVEAIFEAMGVPPEADGAKVSSDSWVTNKGTLAKDWSKLMVIVERLQKALESMLTIMASGDGDWGKEFIEFGKIKVALEALSGRNQVVDSHPVVSFLLLEKVLPALSSLLNTNGANLSSSDLAYVAKLSLGYIDQVKDSAPPQNKNDFLSFWKNNI